MNEAPMLVLSCGSGALLGALFFGGLWWTVRKAVSSGHPALLVSGSLLVRTAIVLAGFYLVAGRHWQRLVLCLLGFVMARLVVMRWTRAGEGSTRPPREASHAP